MNNDNQYEMTVDLNVLDHLGINLYSNIAAVLTETVANAWDADASTVNICISEDKSQIEIEDNGIGMTVEDMNSKYLRVGYRRRDDGGETGAVTSKGRPVMGRKGLGKLSLFSIAEEIEVQSSKDGESHGLLMEIAGIKEAVANHKQTYQPIPLKKENLTVTKGTLIKLRNIKRQRLGRGISALRKRLSRRFSIMGEAYGFEVKINGKPLSTADRGDLPVTQFLWYFGEQEPDLSAATQVVETGSRPDRIDAWDADWKVKGWIGTSRFPKQLDDDEAGNLNSIVVFARGRLFHENILDKLNDGRLFTKYLTGQIEADFLDEDDESDIATSDRQRVQEDDARYVELLKFLKEQTNAIEKNWSEWRKKHEVEKAKEEHPALTEWFGTLPEGFRKSAEHLVAKISSLPVDLEEDRKLMYRHGILAFERMKLRGSVNDFVDGIGNIETILTLLADRDSLEATLYRDIVKSRLEAIKSFQGLVDANQKEKVLQEYLFDHLWLLDPSWERSNGSEIMESRLMAEGVYIAEMSEKERLGRVDIKYRTTAGKHIIIELKKAGRKVKLIELQEQGQIYVDKMKKICVSLGESNPNIEVVFIIGVPIEEESENPDRVKASMNAVSPGSRIKHYDELIKNAQNSYSEYISKSKVLDKLDSIVEKL